MKGYYIFGCATCYGVRAIADTFESMGVPIPWVSADQIRAIVMPKGKYSQLRAKLESQGIRVLDYTDGDIESRQAAIDTVEDVKFKTSKNTTGDGGVRYKSGITQETINDYVDAAYEKRNNKDRIKYADVSMRLLADVSNDIDISGYVHALRDNDIRHIRNSHGEETNEKYPVTKADIARIPYIVENYHKVFVKTNAKNNPGIVYVMVGKDNVVYYVEAVTEEYHNEKLLVNKQMVKTGIDEIPNLHGLIAAINKKESASQYLADLQEIRKAYVQDAKESRSRIKIQHNGNFVKKISTTDSDGNQLTAGQQKYFAESEAVDENGNLLSLFHQTADDITEFDPRHPGAGRSDYKTPFGIFLKRTDRDIGLKGKKQMRLYAKATNPLRAENREELVRKLREISPEYAAACDEITEMDRTYEKRVNDAGQKLNDYMIEWRRNNPDASRRAIYDDATYNELSDAEDALVDEWVAKDDALSVKAKEIITAALIDAGYDSVFLTKDAGSFGRETDAIIVQNPNQVKSVDNKNPTDDPDIRYKLAVREDTSAQALLSKVDETTVTPGQRNNLGKYREQLRAQTDIIKRQRSLRRFICELYRKRALVI